MEMPISVIVVIVIALAILLSVMALFFDVTGPNISTVNLENARNSACQLLISSGCIPEPNMIYTKNFDADKDGQLDPGPDWNPSFFCGETIPDDSSDNLATLCKCFYNIENPDTCKQRLCDCT